MFQHAKTAAERVFQVRRVQPEETYDLRRRILRANQPDANVRLYADTEPRTAHFGAYLDGALVGTATFMFESREGKSSEWRLRGMATLTEYQGRGVGRALLGAGSAFVREQGGEMIWCNARETALGFYLKLGFAVVSEKFQIPEIGPHFVMERSP